MKLFFILLVVLILAWMWRSNRVNEARSKQPPPTKPQSPPLEMVSCAQCDVHVLRADAVVGRAGLYCCTEHRHRAES